VLRECLEVEQRSAAAAGVSGSVFFLGYVDDTLPWIRRCSAAVSASLSEGLPLGVMEALACEKPAAVSRVKGHTDLPGTELFDPSDVSDTANTIIRTLLSADRERRRLPREFSLQEALPPLFRYYKDILGICQQN
jgi:glycosyltransferase involved in cell wall biosynthesis